MSSSAPRRKTSPPHDSMRETFPSSGEGDVQLSNTSLLGSTSPLATATPSIQARSGGLPTPHTMSHFLSPMSLASRTGGGFFTQHNAANKPFAINVNAMFAAQQQHHHQHMLAMQQQQQMYPSQYSILFPPGVASSKSSAAEMLLRTTPSPSPNNLPRESSPSKTHLSRRNSPSASQGTPHTQTRLVSSSMKSISTTVMEPYTASNSPIISPSASTSTTTTTPSNKSTLGSNGNDIRVITNSPHTSTTNTNSKFFPEVEENNSDYTAQGMALGREEPNAVSKTEDSGTTHRNLVFSHGRPELPPPRWYDNHITLGVEDDKYYLSELQCVLRRDFVEAFGTTESDMILPVHGRNKPIALGQVGMRCLHCKHMPYSSRAKNSSSYPSFISGIYNAVQQMFHCHFNLCEQIPNDLKKKVANLKDSTANRGGRKQYWIDSAKRIGLVDTSFGIHFGRDTSDPLPPLGGIRDPITMQPIDEDDPYELSIVQSAEDGSPIKDLGSKNLQEPEYYPLVLPEDKHLISDYLFLALEQMQPCNLMDADRVGCYKGRRTGFPGLACKHCVGQAGCGRYFPASEASLSQTTTSQTLVNHVRNCRRCPIEIREELELMKRVRGCDEYSKQGDKPRHGGRKVFFHRLWCRIQRIPLPKYEKIEENTLHKQKVSTPPHSLSLSAKKRKKNVLTNAKRKRSFVFESDGSENYNQNDSFEHDSYPEEKSSRSPSKIELNDNNSDTEINMVSSSSPTYPTDINDIEINYQSNPIFQGKVRLSKDDDPHWLSDASCFIRQELVEVFTASKEDIDNVNVFFVGQVGIRCFYCAQNMSMVDRPKGHVYYPTTVIGIQEVVANLQRRHLQLCSEIPRETREKFRCLKGFGSKTEGDTGQYWIDSAKELGLCDSIECQGVKFFRNPHDNSPADVIEIEKFTKAPTDSFFIHVEDRTNCTDHMLLLIKQFKPCRFDGTDQKGGFISRRSRELRFPGLMCVHCENKRYFPIDERKLADTTNLMMMHISNCFSAPLDVKASLSYLQHRSLIQKCQLNGNWKITFFRRLWDRLHHKDWIDDGDTFPMTGSDDSDSCVRNDIDGVDAIDHNDNDGCDDKDDSVKTDALHKMRGLIRAASLWLCERDAEADAETYERRSNGFIQPVNPASHGGKGCGVKGRGRGG